MKKNEKVYSFILIVTLIIMTFGSTYAYFAASSTSNNNQITSGSGNYSISLSVMPKFHGYKLIPLKDELTDKALQNNCKDKNNSGACYVYTIRVYDYDENTDFISLTMNIKTEDISNLSYMAFDEDNNPVALYKDENENDVYKNKITSNEEMSLGDYEVRGKSEYISTVMIWLSDTGVSQNKTDLGTFTGNITVSAGKGGKITGKISSAISGSYSG